jgi:hypothetical protein
LYSRYEALARYLEYKLPDSVNQLILAHISRTNNHESLVLESARKALAGRRTRAPAIHVSQQDRPTRLLRLTERRPVAVTEAQGVFTF